MLAVRTELRRYWQGFWRKGPSAVGSLDGYNALCKQTEGRYALCTRLSVRAINAPGGNAMAQMLKSEACLPLAIASVIQRGFRPRPDQVSLSRDHDTSRRPSTLKSSILCEITTMLKSDPQKSVHALPSLP